MKQPDKLEAFIQNNRASFDTEMPSFELWHKIEQTTQKSKPAKSATLLRFGPRFYKIAATVALLIMAAGWGGHYLGQRSALAETQNILTQIAPDFPELEAYYTQEIQNKYQRLVSLPHEGIVEQDLAQIDQAMEELKAELVDAPREKAAEIVENMIQNYQIKVRILERVLERIEAGEQQQKRGNQDDNTKQDEVSI